MEPSETTQLFLAKRGDETDEASSASSHRRDNNELHRMPRRSCLFRAFLFIRFLSTLVSVAFFATQIGLWLLVPGIFVQRLLRAYLMIVCLLLIAAEWEITILPDCLSPSNNEAYRNWFYRGFQYTFVGVIGLEEAFATLGHRYPDSPGLAQVIVSILLKSSASGMFAIGILYMLMRLLFLNKLWERVDASYQQEIEEMRRHQSV
jgi:hypothetical protein